MDGHNVHAKRTRTWLPPPAGLVVASPHASPLPQGISEQKHIAGGLRGPGSGWRGCRTPMPEGSAGVIFEPQYFDPHLFVYENSTEVQDAMVGLPYQTYRPELNSNSDGEVILAGPLSFVQSDWFMILSGMVVVVNGLTLYVELTASQQGRASWILNQACLCFYCTELILRLLHLRYWFFRDEVLWNFLDLGVVFVGVLDQWIITPYLAMHPSATAGESSWLPVLRTLKLARGFRFLKLAKIVCQSDLHWTESERFETVSGGFILASVILMGVETDIKSAFWDPLDNLILIFFVFEITVKLRRQGNSFFVSADWAWNWLDFLIVMFGAFDQWLMPVWIAVSHSSDQSSSLGNVVLLVRMLRLLRILRLIRLVKAVRPLYILALGVVEAMQSMLWVLVLTLVALYISAILMTRMIGHREFDNENGEQAKAKQLFKDIFNSMFTLFAIMNGQEWTNVEPLLREYPGLKLAFVCFTIFSSWSLLSVMTGVVAENMISAREALGESEDIVELERVAHLEQTVKGICVAADPAETGVIEKERFRHMLENSQLAKKLNNLVPNVDSHDLHNLFVWLDDEDKGSITHQDLLEGIRSLSDPVTGRSLLRLIEVTRTQFDELDLTLEPLKRSIDDIGERVEEHYRDLQRDIAEAIAEDDDAANIS